MFAKNCWYVAATQSEVTSKQPLACQVAGKDLVLYRNEENAVVAMLDRCPHRLAPLSRGRIEGNDIRCLYHGIKFSDQGQCTEVPGQNNIPKSFCVKTFRIVERYEWLWIWIGDAKPNESLIPDTYGQNREEWAYREDYLDYDANFHLINDNLLDLSHVAYLHKDSLGAIYGKNAWSDVPSKTVFLERGVHFNRWFAGQHLPMPDGETLACDLYNEYDYLLPGILLMYTGFYPTGTAEKCDFKKPDNHRPITMSASFQAVTAKDEKISRYFFSICRPKNEPIKILDRNWEVTTKAFLEDKGMIEAQQKVIYKNPDTPLRVTAQDKASIYFRSLIKKSHETVNP